MSATSGLLIGAKHLMAALSPRLPCGPLSRVKNSVETADHTQAKFPMKMSAYIAASTALFSPYWMPCSKLIVEKTKPSDSASGCPMVRTSAIIAEAQILDELVRADTAPFCTVFQRSTPRSMSAMIRTGSYGFTASTPPVPYDVHRAKDIGNSRTAYSINLRFMPTMAFRVRNIASANFN